MTAETSESLDALIVRAAESTAAHVRAARSAIGNVIFGQEKVVDQALITILSGGHALLVGVPASPRPSWWKRSAPCLGSTPAACSSRRT
jgi:MoxR-like ATPase